jgi:hypothetical protein
MFMLLFFFSNNKKKVKGNYLFTVMRLGEGFLKDYHRDQEFGCKLELRNLGCL